MERPSLALSREHDGEGSIHPFRDPDVDDQWKLFFQLKIKNKGDGRAENWRVWFTPLDDTTRVVLDPVVARQEAYRRDPLSGRYETILDERTRVRDFYIEPHEAHLIPGRHSIVLKGNPPFVEIQFKLNADNMGTVYWVWRITIDWKTHKVLWDEQMSSEEEQGDPTQPFIIIRLLRRIFYGFGG
jgi:hypothetical protein